jgi:5-methylcytosine-specific restriction endonuclease McrA
MKRVSLDPVFVETGYRCTYCGGNLLADLTTFLTKTRDHFVPRSQGGPDGDGNRVASCAACDRLKGDKVFNTLEEAKTFITQRRASWGTWLERVRQVVMGEEIMAAD